MLESIFVPKVTFADIYHLFTLNSEGINNMCVTEGRYVMGVGEPLCDDFSRQRRHEMKINKNKCCRAKLEQEYEIGCAKTLSNLEETSQTVITL